ncbi:hypothetical protein Aduo_012676 [Ancylostoma duodenale]
MQWEEKTAMKRPLSFSDDSYEWDSIRDDVPVDMGWNSMKVEADKCEVDDGMFLPPNDFSIEWVPSGYKVGGRRGAKRRRLEANVAPPTQKPRSEFTCENLDDGDKEVAASIIELISSSPGTFEFERASDEKYARLLPFPAGIADDRTARGEWRLDPDDCKLESLLSETTSKKCRDISFLPWGPAQQKKPKFETMHVDRGGRMEDLLVKEGEFSWSTMESLVKPQFTAMEPDARHSFAKRVAEMLNEKAPANTCG